MSKNILIGLVGSIGSGKDTAADFLVNNYEFRRESFAASLKDVLSAVFGWDREMLEGKTPESRAWRDQIDQWWSHRLSIANFTPRWALQNWGTEVVRNHFHEEIWIASLENKLRNYTGNVVISDARFTNEVESIQQQGGIIVKIHRDTQTNLSTTIQKHSSEQEWTLIKPNFTINNNGTVKELYSQLRSQVLDHLVSK